MSLEASRQKLLKLSLGQKKMNTIGQSNNLGEFCQLSKIHKEGTISSTWETKSSTKVAYRNKE